MSRIAALIGLTLTLLTAAPLARAEVSFDVSRTERATVELGADRNMTAPGDQVRLVMRQLMAPGWHTYWLNPGGPGMPTTIRWDAPQGVEISPILWPTPKRYPVPPFVNYGYGDEALLVSVLQVPEDWPAGKPIELTAHGEWLICEEQCIMERQSFALTIATGDAPVEDREFVKLADRAAEVRPKELGAIGRYEIDPADADALRVIFPAEALGGAGAISDGYFFPEPLGLVASAADQAAEIRDGEVIVSMRRVKGSPFAPRAALTGEITGIFSAQGPSGPIELRLTALGDAESAGDGLTAAGTPGEAAGSAGAAGADGGGTSFSSSGIGSDLANMTLLTAAALAFLGGLILNVMPCVFPVLAIKALSLVETAKQPRAERLAHMGAYTGGVLASFLALAGVVIALRAAGDDVAWGFQLQSAPIVAGLALIMFVVGLNFSGVFEFSGRMAGVGSELAAKEGHAGSFFTGVLAVVVASPCTAPFMITALGFALTQDAAIALIVFAALGLGFAAPLVALGLSPALARLLPRPGPWMERFRQALAFPMYAAAAILLWVLGSQAGHDAMLAGLVICVLVAAALWAVGSGAPTSQLGRRVAGGFAAICALLTAGAFSTWLVAGGADATASVRSAGFDMAAIDRARAEGKTVFVNATADWCISCKVNEAWALSSDRVVAALESDDVLYVVADYTTNDPAITAYLDRFDHPGVPLYVVYPEGGAPIVLPQILDEATVLSALNGGTTLK